MSEFTHVNLSDLFLELPEESIISRRVYQDGTVTVTYFGFAAGQELTEHTAAKPAILHIVQGEAELGLGTEKKTVGAGTWVHMTAHLPHSILAQTDVKMLLYLLK